jgi:hypothetical protein
VAFWHTLRFSALAGLALAAACSAPPNRVSQGAVSAPAAADAEPPEDETTGQRES